MAAIPNYGSGFIPKKYKNKDFGFNKNLDIPNLFRMTILGPTGSGKTNLVLHILKEMPNTFVHLHVIARNPHQEIYDYLRDRLQGQITFYDDPPSVDQIKKVDNALQFVLIDDWSNDKKAQRDIFSHYFTRSRHSLLSVIFIAHSYFSVDKIIRLNSEYCAILKANSKRDLKMVVKDFQINGIDERKMMTAYERAVSRGKGQMLFVDSLNSQLRYNFKEVINPNEL